MGMIFIPQIFFEVYAVLLDAEGVFVGRMLGAALISLGVINFLCRREIMSMALGAVLSGNFLFHLIALILVFMGTQKEILNFLGWVLFGLHALLFFGFVYFLFVKQS